MKKEMEELFEQSFSRENLIELIKDPKEAIKIVKFLEIAAESVCMGGKLLKEYFELNTDMDLNNKMMTYTSILMTITYAGLKSLGIDPMYITASQEIMGLSLVNGFMAGVQFANEEME